MGKLRIAGVVAAAVLLVAPAAFAGDSKKVSQTGTVDSQPLARVKLTVVKRGGAPRSVQNVRFKDLLTECRRGPTMIDLKLTKAARLDERRRFEKVYEEGGPRHRVKLTGKVRRDGNRVRAKMRGTTVRIAGAGRCEVPDIEFTTKR